MNRNDLIEAVIIEMERVWGEEGFGGEEVAYEWLYGHYGITIMDDLNWQFILEDSSGELLTALAEEGGSKEEDDEIIAFIEDDLRVEAFLADLLAKYKSSNAIYIHPLKLT